MMVDITRIFMDQSLPVLGARCKTACARGLIRFDLQLIGFVERSAARRPRRGRVAADHAARRADPDHRRSVAPPKSEARGFAAIPCAKMLRRCGATAAS